MTSDHKQLYRSALNTHMHVDYSYKYPYIASIPFDSDWVDSMLALESWIESSNIVLYQYKHNHIAFQRSEDYVLFLLRFGS